MMSELPEPLSDEMQENFRRLFKFCGGRPRARRLIRSMIVPCETRIGTHTMFLYPNDNWTDFKLWLDRVSPENKSIKELEKRVSGAKAVVYDIGANCGSFTLRLADAAGAGSEIRAFEPNPIMYARLQKNLSMNTVAQTVVVHNCALGAESGTAKLNLVPGNFGEASLKAEKANAETVEVKVEPLADFFEDADGFERIMIKIDVEGYEDVVFAGFFDKVPSAKWPHDILIETEHKDNWDIDLVAEFTGRGYVNVFENEGNTLFSRS